MKKRLFVKPVTFALLVVLAIGLPGLISCRTARALSGDTLWARSSFDVLMLPPGVSNFKATVSDLSDNVYSVGYISPGGNRVSPPTVNFGNDVTVTGGYASPFGGGSNAVIVKYNSSGDAQWARSTEVGPDYSEFYDVAYDDSGNVYAVGYINKGGEFDFGNNVTITGGYGGAEPYESYNNAVIVKYNSSGDAQWARSTEVALGESSFQSITVDGSGGVYVAGRIKGVGEFSFGNDVTISGGYDGDNAVIVKYNSSGDAQWARSTETGPGESYFYGISAFESGTFYATGYISTDGEFGFGNNVTVAGGYSEYANAVIVKYNSSGDAQWARSTEAAPNYSKFYGVATDSSENIYTVGFIYENGQFGFGNDVTVAGGYSGYDNAVIVKYNSSGDAQWARSTEIASNYSGFVSVIVDISGNIYAAGYIYGIGEFDFGNDVTISGGYNDENAVIVKYNSSGDAQWARSTEVASNKSFFYGTTDDSSGDIYAVGFIYGDGEFDFGNEVTVTGASDEGNLLTIKYKDGASPTDTTSPTLPTDTTSPTFQNLPGYNDTINISEGQLITTNPYLIKVKPSDSGGISKVEFYIDDTLICISTVSSADEVYSCAWDTSKYHSKVTVYAYDNSNNKSDALERNATVDPKLYLTELPRTGRATSER